ncbi:MAG: hypothetical protein ACRERD_08940, partial [Candidatus Binatia bacterium]
MGGRVDLSWDWPTVKLTSPLINVPENFDEEPDEWGDFCRDATSLPPETLHGVVQDGERTWNVTLLSARSASRDFAGEYPPNPGTETIEGDYLLWGCHEPGDDICFMGCRIQLKYLDSWARIHGDGETISTPVNSPLGRLELLIEHPSFEAPNYRGANRSVTLGLSLRNPMSLDDLMEEFALPIRNLFAMIANEQCPITGMQVYSEFEQRWVEVRHPSVQPPRERLRGHRVLWDRDTLSLEHVARWLEQADRLYPIPAVIEKTTGTHHWEFEAEVLALAACAEGIHMRLRQHTASNIDAEAVRGTARDAVAKKFSAEIAKRVYRRLNHFENLTYKER